MAQNTCYTYFTIIGKFDPDKVTELLSLIPHGTVKAGDPRRGGGTSEHSIWRFGKCDKYDVYTENQMRATIAPLKDKIELLNRIREENEVEFYLEIVPTVTANEPTPCLAPPMDVIDFCHATRTQIDIDLYIG